MGYVVHADAGRITGAAGQLARSGETLEVVAGRLAASVGAAGSGVGGAELAAALTRIGAGLPRAVGQGGALLGQLGEATARSGAAYSALETALVQGWGAR